MLDRSPLTDAAIAAALGDRYGIETTTLEFLALGHDANAWTLRGRGGSRDVFVKVRRAVDVAPLATDSGDLSTPCMGFPHLKPRSEGGHDRMRLGAARRMEHGRLGRNGN